MNCQKLKGVTELRKGCSSESSLKAASRHFDLFLEEVISSGTIGGKEKQQLFPIRSINNSTDSNNIDNSERLDGDAQTQYSFKTIAVEKINDKLLNLFAGYLTRAEKLRGNKNETQDNFSDGNGISYNTAERYLSSIKNEILRRCLDLGLKRSFDDVQQTRIRQSMTRRFVERAVRNKTPLARSHVTAARNDFLVIALLCIWDGSFPMADMLFYLLTLRYLAGRGQEVAMISRSRVSLGEPSEWADSGDKTFVVRLWRSKVSHEQDLSIVPHQSEMLLDWVFAFAYSAVMNTNPNDSLFPTFAEKVELRNLSAGNINDEEIGNETTQDSTLKAKVDSSKKVTKYFQALLERLIKTSEELVGPNEMARAAGLYQDDEDFSEEFDGSSCVGTTSVNNEPGIFNLTGEEETVGLDPPANAAYYYSGLLHKHGISAGLSTHSAKRSAVEMANESALLLTTWVCFRAGWLMKAVHTIFDYLSFNPKNDRQVSRVFSEWNTPSFRGEILGGRPPRLHPIRLQGFKEAEKVCCFVAALFVNYEDKGIDSNIFCTIDDRKSRLRELRNLYDLLTATILRYLPKFVKVLQEHPNPSHPFRQGQRTCIEKHPFLLRILKASQTAGILWDELKAWSTLVQKDFLERNFESASWSEMLEVVGEEQFSADPRTLGGYMETTNRTMNTIQLGQSRMLETTSIHDARLKELTTTVSIQGQAIEECRQALAEIKTLLKEALGKPDILIPAINQGQEQLPINPSAAERMLEIDQQVLPVYSLPEKLKDMDLTDLFQQWHFQQWHLQMYSGGTKQRGISSQIRFGMEYFSLFLPAQVPPLPTGTVNPMELLAEPWRRQIRFLANKAFEAMADFFETKGLKVPKSLTPFKKAMFLIDASEWPKGPQDPSPFPILSKKGKKEELRNYDCLQKSQEKEKLKVQNRLQKRGSATKQTLPVVVDTT